MNRRPLIVDLDGTLIKTDLLMELVIGFIRLYPQKIFYLIYWLMQGGLKCLKLNLAEFVDVEVSTLPYNKEVIKFLKKKRSEGVVLILATGTNKLLAIKIAEHLKIFDEVFASDKNINLTGNNKKDLILKKFGPLNYDYIGNSKDDIPSWKFSKKSYAVNLSFLTFIKTKNKFVFESLLSKNKRIMYNFFRAIRVYQWFKNILLFIPIMAAHRYNEIELHLTLIIAFIAFSFCSSSIYIINDLLDLESDRMHQDKRYRPFAIGDVSIKIGIITFPLLLGFSFYLACNYLPLNFIYCLLTYFILSVLYSFYFKRIIIIDIILLCILYTIRVVSGSFAVDIKISFWLLLFSMFIFLSLALMKRHTELYKLTSLKTFDNIKGRGYSKEDINILLSLGTSSGYISVLILAFYIDDINSKLMYENIELMWLACPALLAWISRIWLLSNRGLMKEDPLIFCLKDIFSLITISFIFLIFIFAK